MASHALGDGGIPPRDATKKGLTRVMTEWCIWYPELHGEGLRDQKGKQVLVETLPFSVEEAMAAEEAGIDTMKVRFDPNMPGPAAEIRKAAPNTFMAFSVPLIAARVRKKRSVLDTTRWRLVQTPLCASGAHALSRLLPGRYTRPGPCGACTSTQHLDRWTSGGRQDLG